MKKSKSLTIMVLLFLMINTLIYANQSISGYIRDNDTGEPLPYANIILPDLDRGTTSNGDGYYVISNVPVGEHRFIVSIIGYTKYDETVSIPQDIDKRIDIRLKPSIISGQVVEVSAEREKFRELISTSTVTLDRRSI